MTRRCAVIFKAPTLSLGRSVVRLGACALAPLFCLACSTSQAAGADSGVQAPADAGPAPCPDGGGALARCISPDMDASYYVAQALDYFDTLDVSVASPITPDYSTLVARWEWPPWLELTGFNASNMEGLDELVRTGEPATVPVRECLPFETQPFVRCRISFAYDGGPCPIYEEFTFNQQGQTTFIEAWSDQPGLLPMADAGDPWGEGDDVHRLSTKLPGLGDPDGLIDLDAGYMAAAAARDPDIAAFVYAANDFWGAWSAAELDAGSTLFKRGCGW